MFPNHSRNRICEEPLPERLCTCTSTDSPAASSYTWSFASGVAIPRPTLRACSRCWM